MDIHKELEWLKDIVEVLLELEYPAGAHEKTVTPTPEKLLDGGEYGLMAQSLVGDRKINMRSPALKRVLLKLADLGCGHTQEWNKVKFQFQKSTFTISLVTRKILKVYVSNVSGSDGNWIEHTPVQPRLEYHVRIPFVVSHLMTECLLRTVQARKTYLYHPLRICWRWIRKIPNIK